MAAPCDDLSAGPNAAQVEYWNVVGGPKWAGLGTVMDARMAAVHELLLIASALSPGQSVLDVGCGMGTTTLASAERVGPSGRVLGIDISTPMLEIAQTRIGETGFANISLLKADAQTHAFSSQQFDRIISRFGVMFFADPVAAFRNLRGAMRPGAKFSFVCWAPLSSNPHWQIPLEIVSHALGVPASELDRAPGPLAFADLAYLGEILENSGFRNAQISTESVHVIGGTPEEEAKFSSSMGPAARLLQEHAPPDDVRDRICRRIATAFAPYANGNGTTLPASVHLVVANQSG